MQEQKKEFQIDAIIIGSNMNDASILTELSDTITNAGSVILKIIREIVTPSVSFKIFSLFNK